MSFIAAAVFLHGLTSCKAQQIPDSLLAMGNKLSGKYINAVIEKTDKVSAQLDKQTERYLLKLEKQEAKLKKKLSKIDSLAASKVFVDAKKQYDDLQQKIKNKSNALLNKSHSYLPWLDSASTSLKFLDQNSVFASLNGNAAKLKGAVSGIKNLENQFKQAVSVKDFIQQRKEYLKQQLQQYNFGSGLKKYNQTAYYYSQQINEYRQTLTDPDKAEKKALELLNKIPTFQGFMRKNSMLSSLFAVPNGDIDRTEYLSNLPGLQTRTVVQNIIQRQLTTGGSAAQTSFQQSMQTTQSILNSLKSKLKDLGTSKGGDLETADFKPNVQKTKPFLRRLEYGMNFQSVKSNAYFPTTTDIAISIGYKLNNKSIIGIGGSLKVGWGKDIQHISITGEGLGIRSFVDFKLKGSVYASGGFEYNYQQPFRGLREVYSLNSWQQSGLLGVSKIVSLKTKYFKKNQTTIFMGCPQLPADTANAAI